MDILFCINKGCRNLYRRELHGCSEYMCTARKGRKVRETDLGSGRLIQVKHLKECPLENPEKNFRYEKK